MEGINNLGSTCAINSLIQMICRCEKLREIILKSDCKEGTFIYELKEILDLIHNKNKSINPMKFINNFYDIFKGVFNRFEQIDITELWFYLCEKINEETAININPKLITNDHDHKIAIYNNYKTSHFLELIQGSFINIIQCDNCNHKTHSFEPFITIALDINENKTLADLFMTTLINEKREADHWKCENCNGNHSYFKAKMIWKLPEILVISLNRFKDIYNKNNEEVYINENLNFIKGSILSNIDNNYNYELQSIGLHFGNLLGGHYMSICNINNETFNLYNDDNVRSFPKNDFINNNLKSNNAYLIIYKFIR